MSFSKMSAKLIVHKFESGNNLKSLQITFDDDNCTSDTKFGEWRDGRAHPSKKDKKSSRLVVKIVADNADSNLNLFACAKEVNNDKFLTYPTTLVKEIQKLNETRYTTCNNSIIYNHNGEQIPKGNIINSNEFIKIEARASSINEIGNSVNPLEYSLERVKENNARIMENIHLLNRTLDYTKKKEIFDTVGTKVQKTFPCNICGKCFVYETGLKRHVSLRHTMTEIQPRWQTVWTCIECYQVWPRPESAIRHSNECCNSDNVDCIREIKTSSLLKCEFCEKVYTSIPRLLRHTTIHTIKHNYECNACEKAFTSYKAAEQHWQFCPWIKTCYNFSLPRHLLCNACDRKFRNYDHLYNHRYKVCHFMGKSMGAGTLAYQCEICGQCFNSIAPLQIHRNQYHLGSSTGLQYQLEYSSNLHHCKSRIPDDDKYQVMDPTNN